MGSFADSARRHPWGGLTALAGLGGVVAAWFMQGQTLTFVQLLLAASAFVFFGLAGVAGLIAAFVARWLHGGWRRPLSPVTRLALVLAGAAFLSFFCGGSLHYRLVESAKRWSLEQVSRIDRYREVHGAYPSQLKEVVDLADAPRLVRKGDLHYSVVLDQYGFELYTSPMGGWYWDSTAREWELYD